MSDITTDALSVYRDFKVDGDPTSGAYDPPKSDIRNLFTIIDNFVSALMSGTLSYSTRAALYADLTRADGQLAYVYADSTTAYNTYYQFNAHTSPPAWTVATWYINQVTTVVQPLVDEVNAAVASINGIAANIYDDEDIFAIVGNDAEKTYLAKWNKATGQVTLPFDDDTLSKLAAGVSAQAGVQTNSNAINGLTYGSAARVRGLMQPNANALGATITCADSGDSSLSVHYSYISTPQLFSTHGGLPLVSVLGGGVFSLLQLQSSPIPGGSLGTNGVQLAGRVGVMTDAPTICFPMWNQANTSRFRAYVNGVPIAAPQYQTNLSGTVSYRTISGLGTNPKRVDIEWEANGALMADTSAMVPAGHTIWAPPAKFTLGLFMDSYGMSGTYYLPLGIPPMLGRMLGGMEVEIVAQAGGGTGYRKGFLNDTGSPVDTYGVTDSNGHLNPGNFSDERRITMMAACNPSMVIYAGGINDTDQTLSALQPAVLNALELGRSAMPNVPMNVLGPWLASSFVSPSTSTYATVTEAAIKAAVDQFADPNCLFTAVANDPSMPGGAWWYGTGRTGAKNGTGPADYMIGGLDGTDATHPGIDGARHIAALMLTKAVLPTIRHFYTTW